jgi:type II secretory pathway component GspD/PulD (secretin)
MAMDRKGMAKGNTVRTGCRVAALIPLWAALVLGGCVTEPAGIKSSQMNNLRIYSDQEQQRFRPLLSRYNLDPPLGADLPVVEEERTDLFKPYHKYSKMHYLHDDGTQSVHHYLEAGTGSMIATLLAGHVEDIEKVGDDKADLGPNQVTVFPNFIQDLRRTAGVGATQFTNYGSGETRQACDLLVVKASPDKLMAVEDYIARVLTEVPQIEIKVRIIEVTLEDTFEYGVDQLVYKETTGDSFLNTIFQTDDDGNLVYDDAGNLIYDSGGWTTKFNTESLTILGQDDFRGSIFHVAGVHDKLVLDAFLEVLQRVTESQVLTAPKITVLNGHKAVIETGVDVPVQKVISKTTETTFAYEYLPTGVKMVILPTLLMDDTIHVEVNGEVNTISGETNIETNQGPVSIPRFNTRNISDVVRVKDGEAFALGGLLTRFEIERVSKVPLLGDIPILGYLFKSRFTQLRKSHVIFYVEPRIVRPEETIYMPE